LWFSVLKGGKISLPMLWKWYILLVTCAFMICLICIPSALRYTYQANPSCPCYNYYIANGWIRNYSRSSIIQTALAKIYWKGVQIIEFVRISEAKPNILDTAVSNFYAWLKDHTQHKIQICTILVHCIVIIILIDVAHCWSLIP